MSRKREEYCIFCGSDDLVRTSGGDIHVDSENISIGVILQCNECGSTFRSSSKVKGK